jgi:hypothetical protein
VDVTVWFSSKKIVEKITLSINQDLLLVTEM